MASLTSAPEHKANLSYNGFDMSKLVSFSSTTGELRPIYFDVLQAGDKVRMSSELRTRTMPLVAPVMCEIKERIEWFFVPFDQMYHRFGEWFNGINDPKSALYPNDYSGTLPYFHYNTVVSALDELMTSPSSYKDRFAFTGTWLRIMEDLGLPIYSIHKFDSSTPNLGNHWTISISPFIGAAYQKIYADFYRITEREAPDVQSFNFDDCYQNSSITGTARFESVFHMRYRPRRRDFFSNLYTSPIFGNVSFGSGSNVDLTQSFNQWLLSGLDFRTADSAGLQQTNPTVVRPAVPADFQRTSHYLSPTSIRTSFAVEKLLAITQRSAKRVDKQQLAHFGVDMKDGIGTEVLFIGRSEQSIQVGDVISTADTSNGAIGSPLGQLAGKGYSYGKSKSLSFQADRPGVLMAIYSAEPIADYASYGLDKLNILVNPNDFPRPEFDNLGMQPLFGYQYNYLYAGNQNEVTYNNAVIGWQYRWSEWKTKFNSVTGSLRKGRTLESWKVQFSRFFTVPGSFTLPFFYVSPNELDSCTAVNYGFSVNLLDAARFSTDPLIHECYFDVKKSSKMSTYGLEEL